MRRAPQLGSQTRSVITYFSVDTEVTAAFGVISQTLKSIRCDFMPVGNCAFWLGY